MPDFYETQAAKDEAIKTLQLLMRYASTDAAYRGYAAQLDKVLARPVKPSVSWTEGKKI